MTATSETHPVIFLLGDKHDDAVDVIAKRLTRAKGVKVSRSAAMRIVIDFFMEYCSVDGATIAERNNVAELTDPV